MHGAAIAPRTLRQVRLAARLSRQELADKANISLRTLQAIESGSTKCCIREDVAVALSEALDVELKAIAWPRPFTSRGRPHGKTQKPTSVAQHTH